MVHILPITWTRAQLQRQHKNITSYAQKLIERTFPRGVEVDQEDVSHYWWFLISKWMVQLDRETGGAATDKDVESENTERNAGDENRDRDVNNKYTDKETAHELPHTAARTESLEEEASADSPDERQSKSQIEPLAPTPTAPKPIRERLINEIDSWKYVPPKGDRVTDIRKSNT